MKLVLNNDCLFSFPTSDISCISADRQGLWVLDCHHVSLVQTTPAAKPNNEYVWSCCVRLVIVLSNKTKNNNKKPILNSWMMHQ